MSVCIVLPFPQKFIGIYLSPGKMRPTPTMGSEGGKGLCPNWLHKIWNLMLFDSM